MRELQQLVGALALVVSQGCAPATIGQPAAAPAPEAESAQAPDAVSAQARHGPAHTEADVKFMRHMIHHHAQALQMVDLVADRGASDLVALLAERIAVSQRDEIARMEQWLRARDLEVPMAGAHAAHADPAHAAMHAQHHGGSGETMAMTMPGMLTPQEMADLAAARGNAFDRLFLESMIRHHEGALVMVEELFAQPGAGQEPEIYQFAAEVAADQQMEIDRMRTTLDRLSS